MRRAPRWLQRGSLPVLLVGALAQVALFTTFAVLALVEMDTVRGCVAGGVSGSPSLPWLTPLFIAASAAVAAAAIIQSLRIGRRRERQAMHDSVTGLPSRRLLFDRLDQAVWRARRREGEVGLLFIDLDGFKGINDRYGHEAGDVLLRTLGERMRRAVRGGDTVARVGGDEFVVLLADIHGAGDAVPIAEKIIDAATRPCVLPGGVEAAVSCSIGMSFFPHDGGDPGTLVRHADTAMYHAKRAGKGQYRMFDAAMNARAVQRFELEADLRAGLKGGEFEIHYQPQIDYASGRVQAFEALLRWRQPGQGLTAPGHFLPVLEESGLIVDVGRWLLREACRQCAAWQKQWGAALRIAVNVSAREFWQDDFVDAVLRTLRETGLAATSLELEMGEAVLAQDPARAVRRVQSLRSAGVRVTVDDFGAGHAGLACIKRFPVDTLKIDRRLVRDIEGREDAAVARAIFALCQSLGVEAVAGGVETAEQREALGRMGCRAFQGYFVSPALPGEDATRFLGAQPACQPA